LRCYEETMTGQEDRMGPEIIFKNGAIFGILTRSENPIIRSSEKYDI